MLLEGASFQTHLNYIKCLESLFTDVRLNVVLVDGHTIQKTEIKRFTKLDSLTSKSIEVDMALAQKDHAFAVIAAPWFGVKCYYSIYYFEAVLVHLVDGSQSGFTKGGHRAVRKKIAQLLSSGNLTFSKTELNSVYPLLSISNFPSITSGTNTRSRYWMDPECVQSITKKLMEYILHDAKVGNKWNLHRRKDQIAKTDFIRVGKLTLTDFFYWYRIKANYRDLDYIDFEKGITEDAVFEYMKAYNSAYTSYHRLLSQKINGLLKTSN